MARAVGAVDCSKAMGLDGRYAAEDRRFSALKLFCIEEISRHSVGATTDPDSSKKFSVESIDRAPLSGTSSFLS